MQHVQGTFKPIIGMFLLDFRHQLAIHENSMANDFYQECEDMQNCKGK